MAQGIVGNVAKLRAQGFHFALVFCLALLGGFGRSASFGGQRGARFAQCRAVFGKAECRNAIANEQCQQCDEYIGEHVGQVCVRQWRILSEGGFVDEVGSASVVADIVRGRIASGFECGGVVVEMLH